MRSSLPLDAGRSWFRYHHLFADLLQLELRRTAPEEVAGLHGLAASGSPSTGSRSEAIRHAQAARDWGLAARLLADHWLGLHLGGQAATVHALLAGVPRGGRDGGCRAGGGGGGRRAGAGIAGGRGTVSGAGRARAASVPAARRGQAQVLLGIVRLLVAWHRGQPAGGGRGGAAAAGHGRGSGGAARPGRGAARAGADQPGRRRDLGGPDRPGRVAPGAGRGAGQPDRAAVSGVHRPGVPGARSNFRRSFPRAAERSRQAIELAERHGWTDERPPAWPT